MRPWLTVTSFRIRNPGGFSSGFRSWILWSSFVLIGLVMGVLQAPPLPGNATGAPVYVAIQTAAAAPGSQEPAAGDQASSQVRLISYTVQSGDTLWGIAGRYDIALNEIVRANGLRNAEELEVGQVLLLPGASPLARPVQALSRSTIFFWPIFGTVTDGFGWRIHPVTGVEQYHEGIDIAAPAGTDVRAATSGTVTYAGWSAGYGRLVVVKCADGLETRYGHLSGFQTSAGDPVSAGQVIGYVGQSGNATGPHCHFEMRRDGKPLDPRDYLQEAPRVR